MILAGIDEAGLGPALGPLCIGCTVMRVPDGMKPEDPWDALSSLVAKEKKRKTSDKLIIADSKIVHKAGGVAALERAFMAFLGCFEKNLPATRDELLKSLDTGDLALGDYPWYRDASWMLPGYLPLEQIKGDAARVQTAAQTVGIQPLACRCRIGTAGFLNSRFDTGANKSEVSLAEVGKLVKFIVNEYENENIVLVVDKQGGRNYYGPFLSDLFDGAWLTTIVESPKISEYEILGQGRTVTVRFLPKADQFAFPVALASMIAKYMRERFMEDLNAWFSKHIPDLKPTAGYHGDAPRFLKDIDPILNKFDIDRRILIRER